MKHFIQLWATVSGLIILWLAKMLGNTVADQFAIPVPGPVLGMLLVFVLLLLLGHIPKSLSLASAPLLQHMNLLFIPAAVGIMGLGALLSDYWVGIIMAMLVSTILGLWVCVQAYIKLSKSDLTQDDYEL